MKIKKTFTLIELIVVIAIIAILAAVVAPNAFKAIEKSKIAAATSSVKTLKSAMHAFYADTGAWPENIFAYDLEFKPEDLDTLAPYGNEYDLPGWDGPYADVTSIRTPWGAFMLMWPQSVSNAQGEVGTTESDLIIEISSFCNDAGPTGMNITGCSMPDESRQLMDNQQDDGDILDGQIFGITDGTMGSHSFVWLIAEDVKAAR